MTREDWETVKIEDICQKIVSGGTPSTKNQNYYLNGTVPWLKTQEVDFNRIYDTQTYITENALSSSSAKIIPVNSIIIAMYGATAGKLAINKIELSTNQACCNLIIDKERANYNYVFYKLRTMFDTIVLMAFGGAQQNLSVGTIKNLEISLPPLAEQQRIASILSAYDDLLENNTRRIALLEQMAQTLYRQWFVEYKFPGYQDVEMVDSGTEFGMIPQGWEVKKIGDEILVKKGKNITLNTIIPGDIPVVAGGLNPAYYHDTPNVKGPVITISASGANSGYVNLYNTDIWASDCGYIDGNTTEYIFYWYIQLKVRQNEITHLQKGAAQPHVYPSDVMEVLFTKPNNTILQDFEKIISRYFIEVGSLEKQNQSLKEQRDLLLRKLIR